MSQANQAGTSGRATRALPSFERPSLDEQTDPDVTPTRWDIDARALDRAMAERSSTEEIEVEDILEVDEGAPAPPPPPPAPARAAPLLPPPPPSRAPLASIEVVLEEPPLDRAWVPTSFAPVTVEDHSRWLAEATYRARSAPVDGRASRARLVWGTGLGLLAGGVVLGLALGLGGGKVTAEAPPVVLEGPNVVAPPPGPEAPEPLASHPVGGGTGSAAAPTYDVTSLPQAPVGMVSVAASASAHRLFVDGAVVPSGSLVVKCGKHLVKVGSKGRTQVVDVACGNETIVGL